MEIVRHQIVVAMVADRRHQSSKIFRIAECSLFNLGKNFRQVRVKIVLSVRVRVPEVFNILGKVTKEEYVVISDLAGDFDLSFSLSVSAIRHRGMPRSTHVCTVARSNDEPPIEHKLHVAGSRSLRASG